MPCDGDVIFNESLQSVGHTGSEVLPLEAKRL